MISKDSDYLNNKLKQLKTQVLNKKTGLVDSNPNPAYHAFASERFMPTIDGKGSAFIDSKPSQKYATNLQGGQTQPSVVQQQSYNQRPFGSDRQVPTLGQPTPPVYIDPKQSLSNQVISGLRNTEVSFGYAKPSPIVQGPSIGREDTRAEFPTMEPKVKTVYASNQNSVYQPEPTQPNFKRDVSNLQQSFRPDYPLGGQSVLHTGHVTFAQPELIGSRVVPEGSFVGQGAYTDMLVNDPTFFKNLDNKTFLEKYEGKIANELQQRVLSQFDKNNRLGEEIMHLRKTVDAEIQRVAKMDQQYAEEFRHSKLMEAEALNSAQAVEGELVNLHGAVKSESEKLQSVDSNLARVRSENEMLRGELKKLGEMTSEKILELENNINSVARIRELEVESFGMEKEKLANTAEFVVEQMKVHFHESSAKIDDQIGRLQLEKDRVANDLRKVTEDIKVYNVYADQKINNVMNQVIQEEQDKHAAEVKEVESKIKIEEEEIAKVNRRNQELVNRLQISEREGKNRLMVKKTENTRLKEDLNRAEQTFNKLLLQLTNETKEFEKRREAVDILKEDNEDFHNRSMAVDQRLQEEVNAIQESHDEQIKDLDREFYQARDREQKLLQAIEEENRHLFDLQKKHQSTLDDIQRGFSATLNTQFNRVGV